MISDYSLLNVTKQQCTNVKVLRVENPFCSLYVINLINRDYKISTFIFSSLYTLHSKLEQLQHLAQNWYTVVIWDPHKYRLIYIHIYIRVWAKALSISFWYRVISLDTSSEKSNQSNTISQRLIREKVTPAQVTKWLINEI